MSENLQISIWSWQGCLKLALIYFKSWPVYLGLCLSQLAKGSQEETYQQKEWVCLHNNFQWAFTSTENMEQHRKTWDTQWTTNNNSSVHIVIKNYLWNITWMTIFIRSMLVTTRTCGYTGDHCHIYMLDHKHFSGHLHYAPHSPTHSKDWWLKLLLTF